MTCTVFFPGIYIESEAYRAWWRRQCFAWRGQAKFSQVTKSWFYLSMTHRGTAKSARVFKSGALLTLAILSSLPQGAFRRSEHTSMAVLDLFSSLSAPAAKPSSKVCTEADNLECITKAQILQAVKEVLSCSLDQILC